MLTWMWMGMTLWSMGSHSILEALQGERAGWWGKLMGIRRRAHIIDRISISALVKQELSCKFNSLSLLQARSRLSLTTMPDTRRLTSSPAQARSLVKPRRERRSGVQS